MSDGAPRAGDWIAFYGSLMRGLGAQEKLRITDRLRFVGPCTIEGELYDCVDYPALRHGDGRVVAELFAVLDPSVVAILDEFEDYDPIRRRESLYLRESLDLVEPADTRAWVYVYNRVPDARDRIPSGDWRAHLAERVGAADDTWALPDEGRTSWDS